MMAKLEDVAKLANVSKTTVSRVLNHRGYLSEQTINKVHQAMATLNYRPNVIARQLYKNQTNLIGILLPTVANPFFGELSVALERRLYQQHYKVLIGNSMNDSDKEQDYLEQLLNKQIDGLIVGTHNRGIREYQEMNLPVVAIDRMVNTDIPIVAADNYAGGKLATELLLKGGATKIIHVNGPKKLAVAAHRRREAYEDVMRLHGLTPITYEIDFNIAESDKKAQLQQIFSDYPDVEGIFSSNDTDAALLLQIAAEMGRRVPDDFRLIGFDGTQIVRELLPQLTTIIQPIDEIATQAVSTLQRRIKGEQTDHEIILPVKLWPGATI
ncbi:MULTISPECIES: LacI family DNA-binding transcriptional regulator [Lactiplantibacillus]|uniref:LacI family transcriptional regulator n=1 Tax=Lactiplantibacillus pentosus TaxID=1589 RepID=A0ABD7IPT6_LACPE|nr:MULTISPECIES: LacI family DNA-binding transcriptional regulator [Lactiplantibacillus]MCC3163830.1 LacI family DNA-binding transcriptional regulator [Lactiplantibacillus pentosus]MCJ8188805.1 LacI family DNA-binding transcriptional regulator [Lactiplantibacillus pentosus]MCM8609151.1 LacI family DNA-binding transcriptional regulator [Lactiplantibacillus sp. B652]MDC6397272.1 LacI family DNA-binding transcriptional regulator [Lactiplantibacillus pentosus]PRO95912.1 LacI family transcriptional